jgi:hypothetical protein
MRRLIVTLVALCASLATADAEATPDALGATCATSTTVDSLVPGAVREGKRAIWEVGQVQVYDSGPDGNPESDDNEVFAVQGLFVP